MRFCEAFSSVTKARHGPIAYGCVLTPLCPEADHHLREAKVVPVCCTSFLSLTFVSLYVALCSYTASNTFSFSKWASEVLWALSWKESHTGKSKNPV